MITAAGAVQMPSVYPPLSVLHSTNTNKTQVAFQWVRENVFFVIDSLKGLVVSSLPALCFETLWAGAASTSPRCLLSTPPKASWAEQLAEAP